MSAAMARYPPVLSLSACQMSCGCLNPRGLGIELTGLNRPANRFWAWFYGKTTRMYEEIRSHFRKIGIKSTHFT